MCHILLKNKIVEILRSVGCVCVCEEEEAEKRREEGGGGRVVGEEEEEVEVKSEE